MGLSMGSMLAVSELSPVWALNGFINEFYDDPSEISQVWALNGFINEFNVGNI